MDKAFRWKLVITLGMIALSIWAVIPTLRLYSMSPAEREGLAAPQMEKLRGRSMKLGLDLQGGMDLVLELDKSGLEGVDVGDATDRVMEILRNRIDQFGVAEPTIQKQGEDRIAVQLPGLLDPKRARNLIGQTALLEFKLVKKDDEMQRVVQSVDRFLAQRARAAGAAAADSAEFDTLLVDRPLTSRSSGMWQGGLFFAESDWEEIADILKTSQADSMLPLDTQLAWSKNPERVGEQYGRILYVLKKKSDLTGAGIANAVRTLGDDPRNPGAASVSLTLNNRGAATFARITGDNVGRQLAIVLDGRVASAPVIQDKIRGGRASITGSFTDQEARDLAVVLRAGALPAPVNIIEERTVGPSLGRDSIRMGVRAGIAGTIVVMLFMVWYYRAAGLIAVFALLMNVFLLFAVLAGLNGTLTLPGIAGIVLTIGMSVDSNVLIFERIKEELRNLKSIRAAIDSGYKRAFRTILDAHVTVLITGVVLYQFGSGPIRGFAVTLVIGLIANMFTAVLVTRMIYDAITHRRRLQRLSI
jgi:protein-export membrane protein SecD